MIKLIFPLILILGSILIIGALIFPAWQHFLVVRTDTARLQNLNLEIDALMQKRDEITDRISKISKEDFVRLDQMLPSSAQGPEFLVILQNFAVAHNLKINKLDLSGQLSTQPRIATEATVVITTGESAVVGGITEQPDQFRMINASMDVSGSYESFKGFLRDIESYARITDITALQIGSGTTGTTGGTTGTGISISNYRISLQTYYRFGQ